MKVQEDWLMEHPPQNQSAWDNFTSQLHDHFKEVVKSTRSNQLLFTAGDDFFYHKNAEGNL